MKSMSKKCVRLGAIAFAGTLMVSGCSSVGLDALVAGVDAATSVIRDDESGSGFFDRLGNDIQNGWDHIFD